MLRFKIAEPDFNRIKRQGFPEAIYCSGKTHNQIIKIMKSLSKRKRVVLATKAGKELYKEVKKHFSEAIYFELARMIVLNPIKTRKGYIAVITGGTADIPVAEESVITAESLGSRIGRFYDVGVAGIHRLLAYEDRLKSARVAVVVAGMDGALPSVVGGLVSVPVIAVPTSVGYGANLQGIAPLLTMLNSCASNVSVVNIDNGFGAGVIAHLINKK